MKRPKGMPPASPVENDAAPEPPAPESARPPGGGVWFSFNLGEFLRPGYPLKDADASPPTTEETGELLKAYALRLLDKGSGIEEQKKRQAKEKAAKRRSCRK